MMRPALMGILNVTPDSFSDAHLTLADAVRHFDQLVEEGADIIDIGAESTRPGATKLTADEEWARLAPVLDLVIHRARDVRLSVDTRYAQTAARVLDLGVAIVNDVGGLREHAMCELLQAHDGDVVVMHALSIPANPAETLPEDADVVAEILQWKRATITRAKGHGIAPERLIFDPGIGFGKTPAQSMALCTRAHELVHSGGRWLYGHSRKSFLNLLEKKPAAARDGLTRQISQKLAEAGITYLRVHDMVGHRALFDALDAK